MYVPYRKHCFKIHATKQNLNYLHIPFYFTQKFLGAMKDKYSGNSISLRDKAEGKNECTIYSLFLLTVLVFSSLNLHSC